MTGAVTGTVVVAGDGAGTGSILPQAKGVTQTAAHESARRAQSQRLDRRMCLNWMEKLPLSNALDPQRWRSSRRQHNVAP